MKESLCLPVYLSARDKSAAGKQVKKHIETKNLVIKTMESYCLNDIFGVFKVFGNGETAWWADVRRIRNFDEACDFIEGGNHNGMGITQYGIYLRDSSVMLGIIQVRESYVPDVTVAELGYAMSPEGRGHGYMKETVSAICDNLFENPTMSEVRCEILPFNEPSIGVVNNCGFSLVEQKWCEKEVRLHQDYYLDEYILKRNDYQTMKSGVDLSYLRKIEKEEDLYEQLVS